ncbi:pyocin knob domain-containing protein [Necropsobacter massiliensis]|uniref:pyocin knob domain-containing protein n=1 Tax=Necropsobacter massiliensis TaxID=1400001 RepID=UPI000693FFF4|nr:pyocin knob domain-containing protein [Necropsobacter massiliensis]
MANLILTPEWTEGIYQLETSDLIIGGPDGIDNRQAIQLGKRTEWLKEEVEKRAPNTSPAFTGTPTAPTAPQTVNNNQVATTAFVKAAIAALVGSAPATLDTLAEIATALGSDGNLKATLLAEIAKRANKATTLEGYGITDGINVVGIYNGDLNALHGKNSIHYVNAMKSLPNSPIGAYDWGLVVTLTGLSFGAQFYYPDNDGEVWFRTSWGGRSDTWKPWQKLVTENSIKRLFGQSFNGNGWTKFPNGLILQWGSYSQPTTDAVTSAFPITFPNNCLQVFATDRSAAGNGGGIIYVTNSTKNNFTIETLKSESVGLFTIFAIGY